MWFYSFLSALIIVALPSLLVAVISVIGYEIIAVVGWPMTIASACVLILILTVFFYITTKNVEISR